MAGEAAAQSSQGLSNGQMSDEITRAPKVASYMDAHPANDNSFEDMPEILRELTMLRGVTVAVEKAAHDLAEKVEGVRSQRPLPSTTGTTGNGPDVFTPLGNDIRNIYNDLSRLSDRLSYVVAGLDL